MSGFVALGSVKTAKFRPDTFAYGQKHCAENNTAGILFSFAKTAKEHKSPYPREIIKIFSRGYWAQMLYIMNQDLFDKLCDFKNLHNAYFDTKRGKRFRKDVLEFEIDFERNIVQIHKELTQNTYRHGGYKSFVAIDSKKRIIEVAPFRDRLIHHAICNIIDPIFEKAFIYDSYACRKEKGVHSAIKRVKKFRQGVSLNFKSRAYFLQFDIKKYFDSVDHKILISLIQDKIKDKSLLAVIKKIIESKRGEKGLPIGNLTSQLFANIYLNKLDHFVKEKLQARYYVRYMDDFILFHAKPKTLLTWQSDIKIFLERELKLTLHQKRSGVQPIDRIDFLGLTLFKDHTHLRKSTVSRAFRRMKLTASTPYSSAWHGYAKHADSFRLNQKLNSLLIKHANKTNFL